MKRIAFSTVLVLAGTLITCSPPPFNLDISASARAASRLTLLGQVGPLGDLMMGSESSQGSPDWIFFPEKDGTGGITLQAGFIYLTSSVDGQQVGFIAYNGSSYQRYGGTLGLGPVSADPYPSSVLQSVKSLHNGIAFHFDDASPGLNGYSIATGSTTGGTFTSNTPTALTSLVSGTPFNLSTGQVIGLSICPDISLASDRTYWLVRSSGGLFLEGQFSYSQSPIAPPGAALRGTTPYDLSAFVSTPYNRVLYYYDPITARSYANVWDSPAAPGGWSTWVWTDNLTVPTHWQLTTIASRVDALLTTGEMFSTEGNVGRVYDPTSPTGTLEARFTLGTLRFTGEVYIGGTPTVLFSQALWIDRELTFNVYSIPTSQLKGLAE